MKRVWRFIRANGDAALCIPIAATVVWLLRSLSEKTPDEGVVLATLAGALIGGAAVLLGNWLNRSNEHARSAESLEQDRAKLKTLITAELVDVAVGLIGAAEFVDAAQRQIEAAGGAVTLDLSQHLPRDMPFTFSFGEKLCVLEQPAIDALSVARSNLTITRKIMAEYSGQVEAGWLRITSLENGLWFTMDIVAQCFERIAPDRKLRMPGKSAQLASEILRDRPKRRSAR